MNTDYNSYMYFRTSPRGNSKFGITVCPWSRLRHFQQGTDELITLDHVYILRSPFPGSVDVLESTLKDLYSSRCLAEKTRRAGHTEWYQKLTHKEWLQSMLVFAHKYHTQVMHLTDNYQASRASDCPLNLPESKSASRYWINENYYKFASIGYPRLP